MPKSLPPVAAVLAFVDRINHGDLDGLLALATDDHVLQILDEPPVSGEALRRAWNGYFTAFPRYVIHPVHLVADGDMVTVLGNTTGSHLGLPDEEELKEDVIWSGEVREGRLGRWSILADTTELRRARGLPLPRARGTRRGFHTLTPRVVVEDAKALVAFLRAAFDAEGEHHPERPAEVRIGDSILMVSSATERDARPAFLYLYVDDADAVYRRALAAGATSIEEPRELKYGDRRAMVEDPFGNVWQIARVLP
jgi:uncharacterized glyoxalase superfamily protein PhnB/ketosteroid isomerase-like protein